MMLDAFIAKYMGSAVLWSPTPAREHLRGQCAQLAAAYCIDVLGIPVIQKNAADWWTTISPLSKVSVGGLQRGDLVVWGKSLPGSGGYGHIGIFITWVTPTTFISFSTNWGGKYAHYVTHDKAHVLGGLRRHVAPQPKPVTTQGAEPMIADNDNEYGRWNKVAYQIRGRHFSRDEFRSAAVGKSWLTALEILADDPEAVRTTQAQELGQAALRDNWQGKMDALNAHLQKTQTINNELNATITELSLKERMSRAELQDALSKMGHQVAESERSRDTLNELEAPVKPVKKADGLSWYNRLILALGNKKK